MKFRLEIIISKFDGLLEKNIELKEGQTIEEYLVMLGKKRFIVFQKEDGAWTLVNMRQVLAIYTSRI